MYDLTAFNMSDMARCGAAIRGLGVSASSMEETATRIVRHLYESLVDRATGARSSVLVRFYKTHAYGDLDPALKAFADARMPSVRMLPETKCLTLLGTAGDKPAWNARQKSAAHQAIPLPSEEMVQQFRMMSQLFRQFGLDVAALLATPSVLLDEAHRTFNVFHVADAVGSPFIPAQEGFVAPCGVKSALGFGGVLPDGEIIAIILFTRTPIPRETAELWKTVALNVKLAVLPFVPHRVFG